MTNQLAKESSKPRSAIYHVTDESFRQRGAEQLYGRASAPPESYTGSHMPDDLTRDLAKRMHYAAWRTETARDERTRAKWHANYLHFRDLIVIGNRKLIYRAVRRWMPPSSIADDMVGDCQIVLIQAVAAYNPWIGIRFSTYAFTCLMRALSRLSQKQAGDRLSRSVPLEALPDGEPRDGSTEEVSTGRMARVDEYLRDDNDLLSYREKRVITRRFSLDESNKGGTLEQVGKELGLSKERVRQVQASALSKLRAVLM
ncbi:MAG: sigma-70 family RNA polymerase sigma factor [Planctomycetia bacterium]|nr:sigma-70 family RNA polymerase sigma factor [Planctomycetia bacterium]